MQFLYALLCGQKFSFLSKVGVTGYDSICIIVGCLTKVPYFIPIKMSYTGLQLVELYMARVVGLHGVPKWIVSDRGTQFTSKFWERLHKTMDTCLNFSSAYHP
jgi:hypothetical protein